MSPEDISIFVALTTVLKEVGTWPIGTMLFTTILGPWVILFFVARGQEKRFHAVKQMYENNVKLVEGYEKLANEQQDVIIINTGAITKLTTIIEERLR